MNMYGTGVNAVLFLGRFSALISERLLRGGFSGLSGPPLEILSCGN